MPKHVQIYTTDYCPYCHAAKALLRAENISFEEIDASDPDIRRKLLDQTGRRTVPQIFFGDTPIGGFDDLSYLKQSGKLWEELKE